MKVLPRFKEDEGIKCSLSISLADNIQAMTEAEAELLASYMMSCAVIDEWLSNILDPLSKKLVIPSKTWSDGVYVWDSSHIYYVKKYQARLPKEFIDHVTKQLAMKFNPKNLDKGALRSEFETILEKIISGDESFYAKY